MITEEQAKQLKKGDLVHSDFPGEVWTVSIPYHQYEEGWLVEVMKGPDCFAGICESRMGEWYLPRAYSLDFLNAVKLAKALLEPFRPSHPRISVYVGFEVEPDQFTECPHFLTPEDALEAADEKVIVG